MASDLQIKGFPMLEILGYLVVGAVSLLLAGYVAVAIWDGEALYRGSKR